MGRNNVWMVFSMQRLILGIQAFLLGLETKFKLKYMIGSWLMLEYLGSLFQGRGLTFLTRINVIRNPSAGGMWTPRF